MKFIKSYLLVMAIYFFTTPILSQNQAPIVENVAFSQRTDGSFFVDVYYDVNDPEGSLMTVSMQASSDNGVTWTFSCDSITGNVGTNITNGTGKHIEWDFGIEHPQTFSDQFRIKIIADDGGGTMGVPCPGIPTVTYEGKTYNTVQIGDQCWLKENLDVGTMINSIPPGGFQQTNNGIIEKYCYDNDPANCESYGGLYEWPEAMQYSTTEGAQGICPTGWHIPTLAEFQTLSNTVGGDGNALKREDQGIGAGQGTNTSGFSALLAGDRDFGGPFYGLGFSTVFWSSMGNDTGSAYYLDLNENGSGVTFGDFDKEAGFSVRCLKD